MLTNGSLTVNSTSAVAVNLQYVEPPALRVFRLVLLAVIILASLVGNSTVIRAVFQSPGTKTMTYCLVCNLALAELISTCCLPFIYTYMELSSWPFGNAVCHLIVPLQTMAGLAVTSTIATIAVYRCSILFRPSPMKCWRCGFCLCTCVWLAAFAVALPSFIHTSQVVPPHGAAWCLTILPGDSLQTFPSAHYRAFVLVVFVLNYAVPGFVMVLSYGIVAVKLRHRNRVMSEESQSTQSPNSRTQTTMTEALELAGSDWGNGPEALPPARMPEHLINPPRMPEKRETADYEIDILSMFYAIVLIFMVCYLPYQVFFLLEHFGHLTWQSWSYFDLTRSYVYIITCVPSALHPLCYGLMSKFYARALAALYGKCAK